MQGVKKPAVILYPAGTVRCLFDFNFPLQVGQV